MKLRIITLGLMLLALVSTGNAADLSGTYVLNFQRICQVLASGGQTTFSGRIVNLVGTIYFSGGFALVNGITVSGSLISSPTSDMQQQLVSNVVYQYSTTDTTLTIAGMTLNAVYHHIVGGVAQKVIFNGQVNGENGQNDCAAAGTLEFYQ